jgi:hypothetical protein
MSVSKGAAVRKESATLLKKALILSALLSLVALTGVNNVQPAQAACFYPHGHTTEYWAWVSNNDPNDVWCDGPVRLGYPGEWGDYYHWAQVGERTVDCDGTVSEWGVTGYDAYGHNCATFSTVTYSWECDPICE